MARKRNGTEEAKYKGPDGTRLELLWVVGEDEAFVTVARPKDGEDAERVAIVGPAEALKIATELIRFASQRLAKVEGGTNA